MSLPLLSFFVSAFLQFLLFYSQSPNIGWPWGFDELNSFPHFWTFTSVSVAPSSRSYLFTSATDRIPVHIAPKCGTEPIRYVMLHFQDRRGAALLRYKNRTEITVHMCDKKPYPEWFSCVRKSYPMNLHRNLMAHISLLLLGNCLF